MRLTQKRRAYIYRVLVTLGPAALLYGLLTAEEVAVWLAAAAAVLGNGLAAANTPTGGEDG